MYHIDICDDEKEFIEYIKMLVQNSEYGEGVIFHEHLSGEALIEEIADREKCDLLILDMQLGGMNGNQTAKAFRKIFPKALLVFCSGMYQPTVENFEVEPYRYLLKDYTQERMKKEIDMILQKMKENSRPSYLIGKQDNHYMRINLNDVWYIEVARRKSILHCNLDKVEELYSVEQKVADLYEQLKHSGFAYAHNSYIVNLRHVSTVRTNEMELENGKILTIARSKQQEFRQAFACQVAQKY